MFSPAQLASYRHVNYVADIRKFIKINRAHHNCYRYGFINGKPRESDQQSACFIME